MLDQLFPATPVIDDEQAATGHRLERDPRKIFVGFRRLDDAVGLFVKLMLLSSDDTFPMT